MKKQRRFLVSPSNEFSDKKPNILHCLDGIQLERNIRPKVYKSKSIITQRLQKAFEQPASLQISTVSTDLKDKQSPHFRLLMRKSRYRTKLQPLKKQGLSNNVKDYLSVQKINLKDFEEGIMSSKSKQIHILQSNLLDLRKTKRLKQFLPNVRIITKKKQFVPPFDTYYYRDFIWKVGYSNQMVVQFPIQYQNKIKVYVGGGNNSRLVKGIINRRTWYQITQKIDEANFVWTQIKNTSYLNSQKGNSKKQLQTKQLTQYIQKSILNQYQNIQWKGYWSSHQIAQSKIKQDLNYRNKILRIKLIKIKQLQNIKIHNHFQNNFIIGNKKALFHTMSSYYKSINQNIFDNLPLTFHIKNGLQDDQYLKFLQYFYQEAKKAKKQINLPNRYLNVWIVKPGQLTNRGNGIIVCLSLQQIKSILKNKQKHQDGTYKTYIVQKYIQRPLLYKKRKFDLRHYMVISCINGIIKGYWCKQGYVRTTSSEYTLKAPSGSIHLTNDAVQKLLPDYGKYQKGNKLSYQQLQIYLSKNNYNIDFWRAIYPKMKKIGIDTIRASAKSIDLQKRTNFQIFGLDFMIDQDFNVWLIQVNSNPCLQLSCPLLGKIIPKVIENMFQLCLDSIFPPPIGFAPKNPLFYKNIHEQNCFQLVYDQRQHLPKSQQQSVENLLIDKKLQEEEEDVFEDDGEDWCQD